MRLTFTKVLVDYFISCIRIKQKLNRKNLSKSDEKYLQGQKDQNFYNFERIKDYLKSEELFTRREPTKTEIEKYKIKGEYPVVGIFEYRGESSPIYCDDYGQQEFLIYKGKELSGGSFNYLPEYDWMYVIDGYLEKDFFEDNSDEPAEWKKLKELHNKEILDEKNINKKKEQT